MKNKRFLAVMETHKDLQAMFSGIILSGIALIVMAVTASILYL